MKKTYKIFSFAVLATALCIYSCTKDDEKKDDANPPDVVIDDPDPQPDPDNDTLTVNFRKHPPCAMCLSRS